MSEIRLINHSRAGDGLYLLRFEAPEQLMDQYSVPGQYAIIRTNPAQERPAFFAVASGPADNYLEFLIKQAPGAAADLAELSEGQTVECESIQGPGFKIDCQKGGPDVHMFSMGSGYAPFRALIRFILASKQEHCNLHLWQAAFRLSAVPLLDELAQYEKDGTIKLHLCLDDQTEPTEHPFFAGQVQEALRQYEDNLKESVLLWIGSHEFNASLKEALASIGVDPDALRTNY